MSIKFILFVSKTKTFEKKSNNITIFNIPCNLFYTEINISQNKYK